MTGSEKLKWWLKPVAWGVYFVVVFEVLFMISPLAVLFYSVYGPGLNLLNRSPTTSWLTQFFLPHFSQTTSGLLNACRPISFGLIFIGSVLFLAAALPLYARKLLGRGQASGGLYRFIRHPQYVTLAILGLGTTILWPRFVVLLTFVAMVFIYGVLASWEEKQCLRRFGSSYVEYAARTGMFLPRSWETRVTRFWPTSIGHRRLAGALLFIVAFLGSGGLAHWARDVSLDRISAVYKQNVAIISPALLEHETLERAYRATLRDIEIVTAISDGQPRKLVAYVIPRDWRLPDLPLDAGHRGGHVAPPDFDRKVFRVLITEALSHAPNPIGRDIVKTAYSRRPLKIGHVDLSTEKVIERETPPPHGRWGRISTPMF